MRIAYPRTEDRGPGTDRGPRAKWRGQSGQSGVGKAGKVMKLLKRS